jgi:DNA-binding Xre family transcriptional regulator
MEERFKWIVKSYMSINRISSVKELSRRTGINYLTLQDRLKYPKNLRLFELQALDEVLKFTDSDLNALVRGVAA